MHKRLFILNINSLPGRRHVLVIVLLLLSFGRFPAAHAQLLPARAYTFAANSGTYTDLTNVSGFAQDILQDNNASRPYPIGFPFVFEGVVYTEFVVSSDGWLSLSSFARNPNNPDDNSLTGNVVTPPLLAPFWDNLDIAPGSSAIYATLGTAPNRELVMEWRNWGWPSNSPSAPSSVISFQIHLFEATGVIQYRYKQGSGVPGPASRLSATIGLAGNNTFLSLSDASAAPTVSTTVSTNTISQRPATGQFYTFTPPSPCPPPTGLAATATSPTTASISFVPAAGNSDYQVTYSKVAAGPLLTATGTASPILLTGLDPGATYQVTLYSNCANGTLSTTPSAVYVSTPPLPNTTVTWTGAVSTAWNVAGNWSSGTLPTSTTDVIIPAGTRQPLVTGTQVAGALSLQAGATLTLDPAARLTLTGTVLLPATSTVVQGAGSTLSVGGDLTNNGATLTLAPSSILTFGEGLHAVNGTATTALQNLTIGERSVADELVINSVVSVQRLLKATQNSLVLVGTTGTLRVLAGGQVVRDADSFFNGLVTVEQRLSGPGRYYYSAPVRSATLAQLAAPGFVPIVNADYNTSSTPVTPQPTIFSYDQSRISTNLDGVTDFERGFASPTALTEALVPGLGYRLDAAGAATVAVTGPLSFSSITRSGLTRATLPQSGYHLLGNPFAAALDWNVVATAPTTTGLDAALYVYQPASATTGTYQSYVNGVGGPRYLLPGQAFFVRVSAASTPASVSFTQAARLLDYYDPANPPAATPETRPLVQLTLAGATGTTDNATAYFQAGATAGFDRAFDAHKLPTRGVPYLAFTGAQPLSISGLPTLGTTDVTLPLDVQGPSAGTYTLTATQRLNLPTGTYLYLLDALTGKTQDLGQQPTYAFQLSTAAVQRFSLLLTRTEILATAPVSLSRQVAVYPNPAHSSALLALPAELHRAPLTATLLNALGQTVRSLELAPTTSPRSVDLRTVPPGLYSLQLVTPQGVVTKRLRVE